MSFSVIHELQAFCLLEASLLQHFGSYSNSSQSEKEHKGEKSHLDPIPHTCLGKWLAADHL